MNVKANMALREEQKFKLLESRRHLMDTMAALLQERRMIQALIKASPLVPCLQVPSHTWSSCEPQRQSSAAF